MNVKIVSVSSVVRVYSVKMLVVLEVLYGRENYCYQHDIQFGSVSAYKSHVEWCERFLEVRNLCTHVNEHGLMCAQEFQHVSALIAHSLMCHNLYLCVHCKTKFSSISELENHSHDTVHAHESRATKCSFSFDHNFSNEIFVAPQIPSDVPFAPTLVTTEFF